MQEPNIPTFVDFASLYGARDLAELVAVAGLLKKDLSAWLLLHPSGPCQATMMMGQDQKPLDSLAAGQLSRIRIPEDGKLTALDELWAKTLLELLHYQFELQTTVLVKPIWFGDALLAIAGVCGHPGGSYSRFLAESIALAVRRVHELDELRRDLAGYRFLLVHSTKSIVLASAQGKLVNGTEGGMTILKNLRARVPGGGNPEFLPVALRRAIGAGDKHLRQDDIQVDVSLPPLLKTITTAAPLAAVKFSRIVPERSGPIPGLERLTRSERKVYDLLLLGDRNKEIGHKLQISEHTARHHVSAILRKTGHSDRLLLVARSAAMRPAMVGKTEIPLLQTVNHLFPESLNVRKTDSV